MASTKKVYLAADIGAGSGRVMAGVFEDGKITLEEVNRFDNQPIELDGSLYWQAVRIFSSIKEGISLAIDRYGDAVRSVGVDTWGVDYGFLDDRKRLLGIPYCYRDERTARIQRHANELMSLADRYARTGIQSMPFNTLYQLLAERRRGGAWLDQASELLFMPDLLNFWLSGISCNEVTIASTSEMLDAETGAWSREILSAYGIREEIFSGLTEPGKVLGPITESVREDLGGVAINVVTVPSHDTAAAVASCPFSSEDSLFISSGTWSLMGVECDVPYLSEEARVNGLTNERGVEGTVRLLKNIGGFWVFQECKRDWDTNGLGLDYGDLTVLAEKAEPFKLFINPNDERFMQPGKMLERVESYLRKTGQDVSQDPGVISRAIFEGLVLSYREAIKGLKEVTGKDFDTIHIIGGGSQNALINQLAADATNCRVVAGPVEGSSLGNILAQLKADGEISGIRAGRTLIERSFEPTVFEPGEGAEWSLAEEKFKELP